MKRIIWGALVGFLLLSLTVLWAQTTVQISGTVKDQYKTDRGAWRHL
jgi:hypothetical protein